MFGDRLMLPVEKRNKNKQKNGQQPQKPKHVKRLVLNFIPFLRGRSGGAFTLTKRSQDANRQGAALNELIELARQLIILPPSFRLLYLFGAWRERRDREKEKEGKPN